MNAAHATVYLSPSSAGAAALGAVKLRGFALEAVESLTALLASKKSGVVVATDDEARTLLHDRESLDGRFVLVLWEGDAVPIDEALLNEPLVSGVLGKGCTASRAQTTLRSALGSLERRREEHAAAMLERVLEVGRALASEKDLDALLDLILMHARQLTGADGASIYTRDNDGDLYFRLWQNFSISPVATQEKTLVGADSIAGYVARTGETLALDDVYAIAPDAPYRFNPASDQALHYRTVSLLTLPLKNKAGQTVGVLQLINRKLDADRRLAQPEDFKTQVRAFGDRDRYVAEALAGQAGVALENGMLYADIERLFEGFIKASVQAIEARDPTTAGHSFRVADFCDRLAQAVDRAEGRALRAVRFSREQMRELRYAALLHDFGKVGVREHILVKAKKLHPHQLELLTQRFRYARVCLERAAYARLAALTVDPASADGAQAQRRDIERALTEDCARLDDFLRIVISANEPTVSAREVSDRLGEVAGYRFPDADGRPAALLQEFELSDLALSKGSLTPEERGQIESHVTHTYAFLSLIPWTKNLANLPAIAFAHHEKLDGSGYPRRLTAAAIPAQARIMTICDIYDALTAGDRPYKRGLPAERALDILAGEARAGKVDAEIFSVFVAAKAYRLSG